MNGLISKFVLKPRVKFCFSDWVILCCSLFHFYAYFVLISMILVTGLAILAIPNTLQKIMPCFYILTFPFFFFSPVTAQYLYWSSYRFCRQKNVPNYFLSVEIELGLWTEKLYRRCHLQRLGYNWSPLEFSSLVLLTLWSLLLPRYLEL